MENPICRNGLVAATLSVRFAGPNAAIAAELFAPGDPIWGIQVGGDSINVGAAGCCITGTNTWPAAEGPEHAIDGLGQKYLNFAKTMTGFVTTPSAGPSIATSIELWTANDAEERDPSGYQLWGTRRAITGSGPFSLTQFTLISAADITLPSQRNTGGGVPATPGGPGSLIVVFPNTEAFSSYLVVFPDVKNNPAANSMQIAEAQLYGVICNSGVDSDGDGFSDECDLCDGDDAAGDRDGDGVCDDIDGCPDDSEKDAPGICGCGTPDADSDADGVCDDIDPCPNDAADDSDGDGVCDSDDLCADGDDTVDTDADGVPDDCDDTPVGQAACCGGGLPMLMPLFLLGWKRRRRNRRPPSKTVRASRMDPLRHASSTCWRTACAAVQEGGVQSLGYALQHPQARLGTLACSY